MTDRITTYLAELESALYDAPAGLRAEIVAGVREELEGLTSDEAIERMRELGDPAFIAAEALAADPVPEPPSHRTASLVAALVLIFGSIVLPIVGGLIGLAWVSWSKAWSRREKLVAWVIPAVIVVVGIAGSFVASGMLPHRETGELINPLVPSILPSHLGVLALFAVFPIEGVVLLVRASRRGWHA